VPSNCPVRHSIKTEIEGKEGHGELISSAHDKVHLLSIYFLHFPTLYLLSNVPSPEGQEGIGWEPSKKEHFSVTSFKMQHLSLLLS
jgi:hypothetical protein